MGKSSDELAGAEWAVYDEAPAPGWVRGYAGAQGGGHGVFLVEFLWWVLGEREIGNGSGRGSGKGSRKYHEVKLVRDVEVQELMQVFS